MTLTFHSWSLRLAGFLISCVLLGQLVVPEDFFHISCLWQLFQWLDFTSWRFFVSRTASWDWSMNSSFLQGIALRWFEIALIFCSTPTTQEHFKSIEICYRYWKTKYLSFFINNQVFGVSSDCFSVMCLCTWGPQRK